MQLSLLNSQLQNQIEVAGLEYFPNFITQQKSDELIKIIDGQVWIHDLKRRVQHYGWKYDYTARRITNDLYLGQLPDWLQNLADDLKTKGIFENAPDQVIISEYQAGQGISAHIDCVPCFGGVIASLSLGSACVMDFTKTDFLEPETSEKTSKLLDPQSLLVMKKDARYKWQHAIPARKTDKIDGQTFPRQRRISLTFRNVIV
jgi:alkylated DNA repair dioxygenase AlkB